MTTAEVKWNDMHDATLETVELCWATGHVVLHVRTGDVDKPCVHLIASSVKRLICAREMLWGFSLSISEVRGPVVASGSKAQSIEIEMQSGDIIKIDAADFSIRVPGRESI